jgi:prepilin-type processing-associated H-X9-DG protein
MARWVIATLAILVLFVLALIIVLPIIRQSRERANRTLCASNLRVIANSMMVYAAGNNEMFPVYPYAPYCPANAGTSDRTSPDAPKPAIAALYRSGDMNGSVLAAQWLMVLDGGIKSKCYICKSDPFAGAPAEIKGSGLYVNFQHDNQISYSFAYPYLVHDKIADVGPWWRNPTNASIPLAADMAPLNGTGKPARDVTGGGIAINAGALWNSGNHGGDGQNVVFADGHVAFKTRPDVGQTEDNIYTLGGATGPVDLGGTQPTRTTIDIHTRAAPLDIYMVPARNLDTGGL